MQSWTADPRMSITYKYIKFPKKSHVGPASIDALKIEQEKKPSNKSTI